METLPQSSGQMFRAHSVLGVGMWAQQVRYGLGSSGSLSVLLLIWIWGFSLIVKGLAERWVFEIKLLCYLSNQGSWDLKIRNCKPAWVTQRVPVQINPQIEQIKPQEKKLNYQSRSFSPDLIFENPCYHFWKWNSDVKKKVSNPVYKEMKAGHRFEARILWQGKSTFRQKAENVWMPGKGGQHPVAPGLPLAWCICSTYPQYSCYTQSARHLTLSRS